jgi:hypothetical protein
LTQLSEHEINKQKDWRDNWLQKIDVTLLTNN